MFCCGIMHTSLIARFMGPTWDTSGADRTQVGPMLAPLTGHLGCFIHSLLNYFFNTGQSLNCYGVIQQHCTIWQICQIAFTNGKKIRCLKEYVEPRVGTYFMAHVIHVGAVMTYRCMKINCLQFTFSMPLVI